MRDGEKIFQDSVLQLFKAKHAHAIDMEPGMTNPGIPDINWCIDGVEGNLELKWGVAGERAPKIRPTQVVWFRGRIAAGGYPMLAYYIEDDEYTDEVLIFEGRVIEELAMVKKVNDLTDVEHLRIMSPGEMIEGMISCIAGWHDELHPEALIHLLQ